MLADPERALAVAYAPAPVRPALTALFALDERFGVIVGATTEPMIGSMRLAWWREALEKLDTAPAPAEPLLREIAATILPRGISGAALSAIEDGWAALIEGGLDADAIARHGRARGAPLFTVAGMLLGTDDPALEQAGEGWALADLAHRYSSPAVRGVASGQAARVLKGLAGHRWDRSARPLAALAALARRDAASGEPRRQGSPGRLLRMLALRFTGR